MLILGIETSCDDTAAAVLRDEREVLSNVVASQLTHREYGGVVPELASRQHLKHVLPVMRAALKRAEVTPEDLDAVAATSGPGLLGSLLVGLCTAKAYALGLGKPFVGVHHIEGHIMANWLVEEMHFPNLVLVISGGHTQIIRMRRVGDFVEMGSTRDDAAGEAFDKIGKMLGIPYPAGPQFERLAKRGDAHAVPFSRARLKRGEFDFSFSGLKTAARLLLEKEGFAPDTRVAPIGRGRAPGNRGMGELEALPQRAFDILASAQEAIVDMLAEKLEAAVRATQVRHAYLAGGVAANGRLRERIGASLAPFGAALHSPPPSLCTDNAAMIACAGHFRLCSGVVSGPDTNAFARGPLQSWC
ncbi:MAG: tRNA (adenosine(37)-N6)-threonylcarbamoyltransferase complex transferase subunit TsaD [Candidatus Latescibacterota bacterium]|nr:MAG: tRNA (adenosine(37)-N6)-threonylcarbamoyltransferase complex transferase subunit TsaD [Candidatus Latescibacterota bacterium]